MKKAFERLYNGIIKENPTLVLMLGMCPTMAVTTAAMNGLGMGLSTTVVLACSNLMISLLRNIIPDKVRMPSYIVVVASFVTMVDLLMQAYVRDLYAALGLYIPLIVVNCIILGRAETYASKNPPLPSLFDGIGMGLGFTLALTIIGSIRELIGNGTVFGFALMPETYEPCAIFILTPGAFFVLAVLTALQNKFKAPSATNGSAKKASLACNGRCDRCVGATCEENRTRIMDAAEAEEAARKAALIKAAQEKKAAAEKQKAAEGRTNE